MTREEFAKKWGHERTMNTMGLPVTIPKYDEFLADLDSLSLPPAEGAEEILENYSEISVYDIANKWAVFAKGNEVAARDAMVTDLYGLLNAHSQRLAEKMVEEKCKNCKKK